MRPELLQREKEDVGLLGACARAFDLIWDYNDTHKSKINKLKQIIEERLEFLKVIELKFINFRNIIRTCFVIKIYRGALSNRI